MSHKILTQLWSTTSTQSAPTNATIPTADTAFATSDGVRGRSFVLELDFTVASGSGTATIDLYLWDGSRWSRSDVQISLSTSLTTSSAASRRVYEIDNIEPYLAIDPVLSAVSGTTATVTCRAAARP